jgi:hypothetical protein
MFDRNIYKSSRCSTPVPWRNEIFTSQKKLRIGYVLEENSICMTQAASKRAVQMAIDRLRAAGHEVVEFEPISAWEALKVSGALVYSFRRPFGEGEKMISHYTNLLISMVIPSPLKQLIGSVMNYFGYSKSFWALSMSIDRAKTAY